MIYKGRNRDIAWFAMTDTDWSVRKRVISDWLDPGNFDANGQQRCALSDLTSRSPVRTEGFTAAIELDDSRRRRSVSLGGETAERQEMGLPGCGHRASPSETGALSAQHNARKECKVARRCPLLALSRPAGMFVEARTLSRACCTPNSRARARGPQERWSRAHQPAQRGSRRGSSKTRCPKLVIGVTGGRDAHPAAAPTPCQPSAAPLTPTAGVGCTTAVTIRTVSTAMSGRSPAVRPREARLLSVWMIETTGRQRVCLIEGSNLSRFVDRLEDACLPPRSKRPGLGAAPSGRRSLQATPGRRFSIP